MGLWKVHSKWRHALRNQAALLCAQGRLLRFQLPQGRFLSLELLQRAFLGLELQLLGGESSSLAGELLTNLRVFLHAWWPRPAGLVASLTGKHTRREGRKEGVAVGSLGPSVSPPTHPN